MLRTVLVARVNPTAAIITLDQAKLACRIDSSDEDDFVQALIDSASAMAEQYLGRTLLPSTWQAVLDEFPLPYPTSSTNPWPLGLWAQPSADANAILLRNPPVTSVDSVIYLDTSGASQTLSPSVYDTDIVSEPGRVLLKAGQSWPQVYDGPNAVRVNFTAGYANAAAIPPPIKTWLLLHVGHFYRNRELGFAANGVRQMEALPYADALIDLYKMPAI